MIKKRLFSLDVFRGMTIAGMIIVNNPGSWKYVYAPLRHAEWHGWTPTDLIFPFFLFIMGVATTFSLLHHVERGGSKSKIFSKIFRRAIILFLLGLILHLYPFYNFKVSKFRIPGVLQRIAICYLFSSLLFIKFKEKTLAIITSLILIGYYLCMTFIPVPGYGAGNLTPEGNLASYIDRIIFKGTRLWQGTWDPEGILSTFPAIATTLLGILSGAWLRKERDKKEKFLGMLIYGILLTILGYLLSPIFPINKNLWTSTYVIFTGGMALLFLSFCYLIFDILEFKKLGLPFVIFGVNPITVYFLSGILTKTLILIKLNIEAEKISLYSWLYSNLFVPLAGNMNGSLLFAISYVLFWFLIMSIFYVKKIIIKI
ncbi:MAG: acyltransferase family protein [Candidatus Aminicenantia bacterium]